MGLRGRTALTVAICLSIISGVVIGVDLAHQTLRGNVLTTALFVATAASWIVFFNCRNREAFTEEVDHAREELHATRHIRHLKSASGDN